jgi:hypothetical protein
MLSFNAPSGGGRIRLLLLRSGDRFGEHDA